MTLRETTLDQRLAFVRACPDLAGVPDDALRALADRMRAYSYPANHVFHEIDIAPTLWTPRLVVHGSVSLDEDVSRPGQGQHLGVGSLFGLAGFGHWAATSVKALNYDPTCHGARAYALDPVWVLELNYADFGAVTSGISGRVLRERLLMLHTRMRLNPLLVTGMRSAPQLARVRPDLLLRLTSGSILDNVSAGRTVLAHGKVPDEAILALQGRLARSHCGGGDHGGVDGSDAGTMAGLRELLDGTPMAAEIQCREESLILRIPRACFIRLLRSSPDFRRSILPWIEGSAAG